MNIDYDTKMVNDDNNHEIDDYNSDGNNDDDNIDEIHRLAPGARTREQPLTSRLSPACRSHVCLQLIDTHRTSSSRAWTAGSAAALS